MRIPVSTIVDSQLPLFVREEYPLFSEFLRQYYLSDKSEELIQNLDKNIDLDVVFNIRLEAILDQNVGFNDTTITVDSTEGFPDNNGLIKINNEIIFYKSKSETQFIGCVRGFSGITKLDRKFLEFSESESERHSSESVVLNLSALYLQQFAIQTKKKIIPGFEDRKFFSGLNASNFAKNAKSFYSSKGSDESFRMLFGALYGKPVDVIKPRDFLIRPSDAQYRVTKDLVVEVISGDPYGLINSTLYQDATSSIEPAQGTVIEATKIIRDNKEYFIISLDFDYNRDVDASGTVKSEFSIHPKTLSTSRVNSGSAHIDVDSTVGFPDSGELKINLEDGTILTVSYQSKVLNQFLDCSGISNTIPEKSEIKIDNLIYGFDNNGNRVELFVNGVLGDIDYIDNTFYYEPKEKIKIKTLGEDISELKANNWFFNISVTYDVQAIIIEDSSNFSYRVSLFDEHNFVIGDSFTLYASDGSNYNGTINFVENEKIVIITGTGPLNEILSYTIRKNISKVNVQSEKYSNISIFNSNVQNIYTDYDKSVYVSSPSLPTYLGFPLEINDFTLTIPSGDYDGLNQIVFSRPHGLFTGESVVLKNQNSIATDGSYIVFVVSIDTIRLAKSPENIISNEFVVFSGQISNGSLEPLGFNDLNFNRLPLRPQNIIKKLESPILKDKEEVTESGTVGILINGVEISNFKSEDSSFYGPITSVDVLDGGDSYNVIQPPTINVVDTVGTGASLSVAVEGSLERIDVIDPGFDYLDVPQIKITGGNGAGAEATVKLVSFIHSVEFNSETAVDTINDIIVFTEDHKFADNEEVIYRTDNQKNVVGIDTNSKYYVKPLDAKRVQLYFALDQSTPINLSGIGTGIHSLTSISSKKKISRIEVTNSGSGYKNKRVKIVGINTASDSLIINNHGYVSGEIVEYKTSGSPIVGLAQTTQYYVTVIDNDQIRLSDTSSIERADVNYKKKKYVDILSLPSGNHYLNYPEIKVELSGRIGISTFLGQDFRGQIQPVFSGKIQSIQIDQGGQNYGSANILNYQRKPNLIIQEGRNAQVTPIIVNGSISRVIVNSSGSGYQQIPELVVGPVDTGVNLTPVIVEGKLVQVIVVNGGQNLNPDNTIISVIPKGFNAKFNVNIASRRVNLVQKLISGENITKDDGFLARNVNSLEYTHLYAPRSLRRSLLRKVGNVNVRDLNVVQGKEIASNAHSPLIGWAYDGNPIYGPYSYANGNSGQVRALKSSYRIKTTTELSQENRPPLSIFPIGFFVDDYLFDGSGDLDENNGRFCITPEFPQGTYAYFCTISNIVASSGPFFNYFTPVFPYIIGPTYKNKKTSQIDKFEDLGNKILRNTTPYKLLNDTSRYEFLLNPNKIKEESLEIIKTKTSFVDGFEIVESGSNYKVEDSITLSDGTIARVNEIQGVGVYSIGVSHTTFSGLEIIPFKNSHIGLFENPHNIETTTPFRLNSEFELNKKIKATPVQTTLSLSAPVEPGAVTGFVTYFSVDGNLNFPLKENDVFIINNEKVRVLSIDSKASRIKVQRGYGGSSVGISTYPINTTLSEDSRKLTFNIGISTYYNFKLNQEYYFNPVESLGIGTVGISTVFFSNPGLGVTFLTIPNKTILLENHQLVSGNSLFYSSNGGSPIQVSFSGIGTTTLLENQELFVNKINNDLISISTTRQSGNELSFVSIGTSDNHSFKTNFEGNFIANISNNKVNVITNSNHGLSLLDQVNVNVVSGITTSYSIFYNDHNRRFCVNKRFIDSIDVLTNVITSNNHKFRLGEKVIYNETSPIGGLTGQGMYYVIPITKNQFKLANSYYDAVTPPLEEINLTSSGSGFFYSINPKIEIIKNQNIIFDVSDSSLSYTISGEIFPAFTLRLYEDKDLINEYFTYNLAQEGIVGIDSTAKYKLTTENIKDNLYYAIIPTSEAPVIKREISFDLEQIEAFGLQKIDSKYSGPHEIISVGSTTFSYELFDYPEANSYQNSITYTTNSKTAIGPIHNIKVTNIEYSNTLPVIDKIETQSGTDAVINPISSDIGQIENTKKLDIGFDYTVDYTIRPKANLPQILRIARLFQLESVTVTERGFGYSFAPDLILIDKTTRIPHTAELDYDLDSNLVKIIQNTNKITDNGAEIIPVNNDNGFEISAITFNSGTKIVTVQLKNPFNSVDEFPFSTGEFVYIEGVSAISGSGYNSSNYGYQYFEILSGNANIGGLANFTFALDQINPGTVDDFYTSGFAIPQKYLPSFDIKLKTNIYLRGEKFRTLSNKIGEVINWDVDNSILKVISVDKINTDDIIFGVTSKNYSEVTYAYLPEAYIDIEPSSVVQKGWNSNVGFLNDSLQRLHDSDYYQYFSYDLRSEEQYVDWTDTVDSLNHTAGFKKFGNLLINTTHDNVGFNTEQGLGTVEVINDIQNVLDVNCVYDFDLVTENYFDIDGVTSSNEIYFNNKRIQNYIESVGNKVVLIDDISDKFLPVIRENNVDIDTFNKFLYRFKKYTIHIFDRNEPQDSQSLLINLLHDDIIVSINQYAVNDSIKELGTFNAEVNGLNINLKFFPFDISNKVYSVNTFSFNISDSDDELGSISLGDVVQINSHKTVGVGTSTNTILSIPDSKSAAKVLIVYSDKENGNYYSDEINYVHDGTNIIYNSYGGLNMGNPSGVGSYNIYLENSEVKIDVEPNSSTPYEVNSLSIEISGTTSTSTSSFIISGNKLDSSYVGVATTSKTLIYSYDNDFKAGSHQILIQDNNSSSINYTELLTMLNSSNQEIYSVEFGDLNIQNSIGQLEVEYSNVNGDLEIYFTPFSSSDYEVRVFSNLISRFRRSDTLIP
jgi:hypothetical protein